MCNCVTVGPGADLVKKEVVYRFLTSNPLGSSYDYRFEYKVAKVGLSKCFEQLLLLKIVYSVYIITSVMHTKSHPKKVIFIPLFMFMNRTLICSKIKN